VKTSTPPTVRSRPPALIGLVAVVGALGLAVVAHSLYTLPETPYPLGWLGVGALAVIAGSFALKVPGVPVYLSISDTFFITSALLFGPAPATLTIAADSLAMSWRRGNAPHQLLFNSTSCAVSLWAAAQVFFWLTGTGPLIDEVAPPGPVMILALGLLATVYFALNSGLVATAVAMQKRVAIFPFWRQHFAVVALSHFAAASTSFFLIVMVVYVSALALVAVLPLIVIFYLAMRSWLGRLDDAQLHVAKVNKLYLSTVSALSTAIEAKDGVTSEHVHRVQAYAMGLARELKITDKLTLQAIEAAALLHDTGKLAIPEHILNKPGKLTASEFETMKTHVDVGADILSSIDFPYPVVPIVRAHHENWDGTGYPNRVRGEDIPIGARILSVVDCFDALTSDRPYRPAMSDGDALGIIVDRRGTMYDPEVVDTFVRVYRDIAPSAAPMPQLQVALGQIRRAHAPTAAPPPVERGAAEPGPIGATEELLAFVSLARLASRTPTVTDIGGLAWGHIRHVVPGASLALFTLDGARQTLTAQYTAGPASSRLAGLAIGFGDRLTGWAALNGRSVLNSDARLDLSPEVLGDLRSALALPLVSDGVVVGMMTLYSPETFAEDRSRMLEMISPHLAVAVASALAHQEATASAGMDTDRGPLRAELRVVARR
jgi:putative nucleotidyltransferase with HDIG domain